MGAYEFKMEEGLAKLKVHNEHYFGEDNYVGNSMHKMYVNFLKGESVLIDCFANNQQELHKFFCNLWQILSKIHNFFGKKFTSEEEKI